MIEKELHFYRVRRKWALTDLLGFAAGKNKRRRKSKVSKSSSLTSFDARWIVLGGDLRVFEVCGAGEGGDVGVCVGPPHRDVEQLPRQDVARPVEPA